MRVGLAIPQYGFSLPGGEISFVDTATGPTGRNRSATTGSGCSDHFLYSFARYGAGDAPIVALEPMTALAAGLPRDRASPAGGDRAGGPLSASVAGGQGRGDDRSLSGGRLVLGLDAGWLEKEFDVFGYDFGSVAERFDALEDAVSIVGGLFGGADPLTHEGSVWSLHDGRLTPPPVQAPIPLWLGGKGGPRLLRLAARAATGWNVVWRIAPADYAGRLQGVRDACGSACLTMRCRPRASACVSSATCRARRCS